ncbi:hypothetical protein SLW70_02455 [Flavobacterium sp. NG2]|uniref:hypothetical protein n=1 Tax=Flavobacterium sp. NG2 TaxID=3097547 RepID=UPI002A835957|nr:hypothetical protein [Flavobacterium sp. NG2]WPR72015.1 hypothetical protein SLW70_02455 [Flavobacterium sp. NG2]
MKTIGTIISDLKSFFRTKTVAEKPQLIAVDQAHFCDALAINDYYCDENNLFI